MLATHRADAQRHQITISAKLDPAPMNGDPRLIERLVDNLTDNALRHNEQRGSVQIATQTVAGEAVLCVSNTGPDVREADISRLLQPFQRDQADRTDHTGGLGLGLSIVHAIVVAHGAKLEIGPQANGGLTITVRFAYRAGRDPEGKNAPSSPRPYISGRALLSPSCSATPQGSEAAE